MLDITLQINLSAGDIKYADIMVRDLAFKHSEVKNKLLVVDCCRPQKTSVLDPDIKYPQPEYQNKVHKIKSIAKSLKDEGIVDEVYYLEPDDDILPKVAGKYINKYFNETHDAKGTPVLSYLVPLELISTRYMIHYDADMLLYQKRGYLWSHETIEIMNKNSNIVFATPRVSPPFTHVAAQPDATSRHEGPEPQIIEGGWLINWFSTRCYLVDNEKLQSLLPLVDMKIFIELILRKLFRRSFPMATEMLFHKKLGKMGYRRLDLNSKDSWLIHPEIKDDDYVMNLPKLLKAVSEGLVPDQQRGWENLVYEHWKQLTNVI